MKTRIFTLLMAFLATLSGAVWGQQNHTIKFADEKPDELLEEYDKDAWDLQKAIEIIIDGTEQKNLTTEDYLNGISAEAGSTISLQLNIDAGNGNQYRYAGYNFISFTIQTNSGTKVIDNLSFVMPDEDVTITGITLQRKVISFATILYIEDNTYDGMHTIAPFEGMDAYFENAEGDVITEALYGEKVRLVLMPKTGYKIENVAKVSRTLWNYDDNDLSHNPQDVTNNLQYDTENGFYYEDFTMPQSKVQVYIYKADSEFHPENGETTVTAIDYALNTASNITNGTITFGEEGTQTTANYQEQVQVNVTPNEGYHVVRSSLYYTVEGSDEQIPIMMTDGTYSFTMPAANVTVHAEFAEGAEQTYLVSIADNIEHGTVSAEPTEATSGTTINLTVTPEEGYQLQTLYYIANGKTEQTPIAGTSFEMPASDVTIYATFKDISTDPGDDNPGGIVPDYPKYYNIYEEEICEGVTVEFSRDVVKEGQSVLVTVKVDEEFDATKMTLKFKRSLFGYWEDLTLTPTENPNEYIIKNIYTDIYVRAEGAVPTGIEDIEGAKVYTKDGSIYVQTPTQEQVQIISASGAVLKNEQQVGLKQYTDLQRGIYIIGIGEARFKVRL